MVGLYLYRDPGNDGFVQCDNLDPSFACMSHAIHPSYLTSITELIKPSIQDLANKFAKPLASTFWVNTIYLIFSASSQLYFTMMSEIFNHGPRWIIAVVFATIGTGICCGSMSLAELVVGRMVQGIGGGGAMSLCFIVMTDTAPESMHSRYSCYILLTRMCGGILGPVIGGLFVDYADWRWAFYFNFIFCALGLLAIPFAVDLRALRYIPMRKLRVLDWTGATLALLGLGALLVGLSCGGTSYRWKDWQTIVPLAVGAVVLLVLLLYESKWALYPQFGKRVFRSRMMTMTHLGCLLHGFVVSRRFPCIRFVFSDGSPGFCSLAILPIILHFHSLYVCHFVRHHLASHGGACNCAGLGGWCHPCERVKMHPVDHLRWLGLDFPCEWMLYPFR